MAESTGPSGVKGELRRVGIWHETSSLFTKPQPQETLATRILGDVLARSPGAATGILGRCVLEEPSKMPIFGIPAVDGADIGSASHPPKWSVRCERLLTFQGCSGRVDLSIAAERPDARGRRIQLLLELKSPGADWTDLQVPRSISYLPDSGASVTTDRLAQPAAYGAIWSELAGRDEAEIRVVSVISNHVANKPAWMDS
jgi:hypothetical protein